MFLSYSSRFLTLFSFLMLVHVCRKPLEESIKNPQTKSKKKGNFFNDYFIKSQAIIKDKKIYNINLKDDILINANYQYIRSENIQSIYSPKLNITEKGNRIKGLKLLISNNPQTNNITDDNNTYGNNNYNKSNQDHDSGINNQNFIQNNASLESKINMYNNYTCMDKYSCNNHGFCLNNTHCRCDPYYFTYYKKDDMKFDFIQCNYRQLSKKSIFILSFFLGTLAFDQMILGNILKAIVKMILPMILILVGNSLFIMGKSKENKILQIIGKILEMTATMTIFLWWMTDWILILVDHYKDNKNVELYQDI